MSMNIMLFPRTPLNALSFPTSQGRSASTAVSSADHPDALIPAQAQPVRVPGGLYVAQGNPDARYQC